MKTFSRNIIGFLIAFLLVCMAGPPSAFSYTSLRSFAGSPTDGKYPFCGSLALDGSTLYGTTAFGGTNDKGSIFKINTTGLGFALLHSFAGQPGGDKPMGGVILGGSTLYGMTTFGGANERGSIFKIGTDGSGFALLHSFSGGSDDGEAPGFSGLTFDGSTLYGMTELGGANSHGTIFKIGTDGSGFETLHAFSGSPNGGSSPTGDLTLDGYTLYGMTKLGGTYDGGIIFQIGVEGYGFEILHSLGQTIPPVLYDGKTPWGNLTLSGTYLYGLTKYGGLPDLGTVFSTPARGVYDVTNTNDSGAGSLRDAINDANGTYGSHLITFSGAGASGTITLASALPTITRNVTIQGPGADDLAINGGGSYRSGFTIDTAIEVRVFGLKMENGSADMGGAIYNTNGLVIVTDCTLSGNASTVDSTAQGGGAIYNGANGTFRVNRSTISGNTAVRGGGIFTDGSSGSEAVIEVVNSTVSGNTVSKHTGGIYVRDYATATITNTTVSGNHAGINTGGIINYSGTVTLKNCIVADNSSGAESPDCRGAITSQDYNLVGNNKECTISNAGNDQIGTEASPIDPLLGALGEYGGPTPTVPLCKGTDPRDSGACNGVAAGTSPAINAIPYDTTGSSGGDIWNGAPTTSGNYYDQRGVETTAENLISIGAYSETYIPSYYYQSKATGNWSESSTWEQSTTGSEVSWGPADNPPDETSLGTTILNGHMVTVSASVTTDQTTVASGGTLTVASSQTLTIANGDGADLTVAGTLTNAGTLTCADGTEVLFSGASDSTISGAGTWTFKTLTLDKDAAATKLDINTGSDVTVETALTVTRGTVDLESWTHDLRLGGSLTIGTNGRWTPHGATSTHYVQFCGADCTFTDSSTGDPQSLGHVKVDE